MRNSYLYNLLLTLSNLLIPIIIFPYVARTLGPDGVGRVQIVVSLSQYLLLVAAVGIPSYGIREVSKAKHDPRRLATTIRELLTIHAATSAIVFGIYVVVVVVTPYFQAYLSLWLAGSLLLITGFTATDWVLSGLNRFKTLSIISIVVRTLSVLLLFTMVRGGNDAAMYLYITLGVMITINVFNFLSALPAFYAGAGSLNVKRHLRPLTYLFGTTIATTIYTTFDSVLLGFLGGDRALGLYTAATRLTKIGIPVIIACSNVLLPELSRSASHKEWTVFRATLQTSYAYIVGLGIPLSVGLFVFAPGLVALLCGPEFGSAVQTVRILSLLPSVVGLGYFWGFQVILPLNKDALLWRSSLVGMVISLILNFLLISNWKQDGAAVANLAAEIAVTGFYYLLIRQHLPISVSIRHFWQAMAASLPFFVFLAAPVNIFFRDVVANMIFGAFCCGLFYGVMQIFVFKNEYALRALAPVTRLSRSLLKMNP